MSNLMRKPTGVLKAGIRSALLLTAGLASGWALGQTISDVPLAVKNNVPPNLMFMIDSSGSMNHIVPTGPYDVDTTYMANCPSGDLVPSGQQIDVNIATSGTDSGKPRFRYNNTNYLHTTVASSGGKCFQSNVLYSAYLNGGETDGNLGSAAVYSGNYLNWYFGNYGGLPISGWGTARKPLGGGSLVRTRTEVAKSSAKAVLDGLPLNISGSTAPALRVGLSSYNGDDGGKLNVAIGDLNAAKKTAMNSGIDGIAASGYTPLAEALADIGRYLSSGYGGNVSVKGANVDIDTVFHQNSRNSCLSGAPTCRTASVADQPIQRWCQRSFTFFMTDGLSTQDIAFSNNTYLRDYDGDCSGANAANCTGSYDRKLNQTYETGLNGSDYLDDVAQALFDIDLRPDLVAPDGKTKKNNVVTYTIGFADEAVQNDPLLTRAAQQGGGRFIPAQNDVTLTQAFQSALTDAFAKNAAAAAIAVANAQITVNNIGYASSYNSGTWYGDVEAYSMDTTTGLQTGATQWSARDKLNTLTEAGRKIASFNGSVGLPFTATNFGGTPATLTAGVVNYIRGVRIGEGSTYRTRQHLLGDIINAEPVVVTYSSGSPPSAYPVVYQAGNDGMLHAFDGQIAAGAATRGQELWAYVPRLVHSKLHLLADPLYNHQYFVDGTPATAEVTGAGAMRLLVGGLGKGGAGYYALDITSPNAADEAAVAAKVKWEFKPANMGYSFGTPLIVNTAAGWRVVLASGYGNSSKPGDLGGNGQGYVWVLDPATGTVLSTMTTGVGSATNPSGLAHLGRLANSTASSVVRYVYGGDLLGNVWRFDLDTSAVVKIATVTDGTGAFQPITTPPTVGPISGSSSKVFVYVGTGRYFADEDVPGNAGANIWSSQRQSMYGIVEDTSVAAPTLPNIRGTNGAACPADGGTGDLVCQSTTYNTTTQLFSATTNAVSTTTRRGWYVDLAPTVLAGGRINGASALTTGGTLVFAVNIPTNVVCDPGGSSYFFQLNATTGGAIVRVQGGNSYYDAGGFLANALSSRPQILDTAAGKRAVFRESDKTTESKRVNETETLTAPWRRIYWRSLN
ncbi:pilus assembly protein [Methylibium sp.]|uniref:pilus assembly protein n=1 Tax=Methylibium sp. TaxID=2067992 RepID=UPI003D0DB9BE